MDVPLPRSRHSRKHLRILLRATRDAQAAKRFFAKALKPSHMVTPRVITVDKNATYPKAFKELKAAGAFAASCEFTTEQISEQSGRTRSPLHQTTGEARNGILFVQDCVEYVTRIRKYEYASERTGVWSGKGEHH